MNTQLTTNRPTGSEGFSLLEMLLVIAITLILAGFAIISINGTLPQQQATAAMDAAQAVFRQGRDSAIAQRRYFQLDSGGSLQANQLQLERVELNLTHTPLSVMTLPSPAQFGLDAGVTDTPDGFCPTPPSSGLCLGNTATQQWLSDGTFADTTGAPQNATVFVHIPTRPGAQRAFTVLGTTGRIRAYRWTGSGWVLQ
ncbi:MAG TPA: prepilin-type N-terminal cleavage/methylation domain-containing protein [Candidatus Binatia bacterium]|nr:prepilin-type N-terminal cleavage/methylation domain-containing protein [Candidatus Binatia bacterium]